MLADNARSEYGFLLRFFGRPEDLTMQIASDKQNPEWPHKLGSDRLGPEGLFSHISSIDDGDSASVISEGNSFATTTGAGGAGSKSGRLRRHVAEGVWKQVFEPSLEYAKVGAHHC